MKKIFNLILFFSLSNLILTLSIRNTEAQIPQPTLIGYFHNWDYSKAPYVPLEFVDRRYNLIEIAFAVPQAGTTYDMNFKPAEVSKNEFIRQLQTLQQQGRKVLISLGGGGVTLKLNTANERDIFITSVDKIITEYGFDGIDLDLESASLNITGGTIEHPIDSTVIYMIEAVKEIMRNYRAVFGRKLLLTMAPETAHVQGGQSRYGGVWGAYLPVINALRDSLDILQTQLYNSGSMYGIDRNIYIQETPDFIVAMCEAVIQGFDTQGGHFEGLPAYKIAVGLPACPKAAGHGYTLPAHVRNAIKYLMGKAAQPGLYKLFNEQGYDDLLGMMTWSINWDAVNTCASSYEYAGIFEDIFGTTDISQPSLSEAISPNPATDFVEITTDARTIADAVEIYDVLGVCVLSHPLALVADGGKYRVDVSGLAAGVYFLRVGGQMLKFVKM